MRIQNAVVAGHEGEQRPTNTEQRPTNTGLRLNNTSRRPHIRA